MPVYKVNTDRGPAIVRSPGPLDKAGMQKALTEGIPGVQVEAGEDVTETALKMTQTPPTEAPSSSAGDKDIVGKAKAALLDPEQSGRLWPGGPRIGPPVLSGPIKTAGEWMLPGSIPQLVTQAIMGLPGKGLMPALSRAGAATGATAGIEALRGKDVTSGAINTAIESLTGEGVGAVGRAAVRSASSALSRDLPRLSSVIERIIPGLKGGTPSEIVEGVVSGEAQKQISQAFRGTLDGLIKKHGDVPVIVASLNRIDPKKGIGMASDVLTQLQSERRALRTMLGDTVRRPDALIKLEALQDAETELARELVFRGSWPKAALTALENAQGAYAKGKGIIRLFGGGRDRALPAQVKRMIEAGGDVSMPDLQAALQSQRGRLSGVLSTAEMQALEQAVRRGEPNRLMRDVPGKAMGIHVSPFGAHAYPSRLPHAPVRIGRPETRADIAARGLRAAGAGAAGSVLEDE